MVAKKNSQKPRRRRVPFLFHAPQANEVFLVGDFNQWNIKKHRMKKGNDGIWEKTLVIKPGIYEYKYLVDGSWQEDPDHPRSLLNSFGTYNNVLTVVLRDEKKKSK
jgi:5'-AMP-activated protein kinase regulatory beta subunit